MANTKVFLLTLNLKSTHQADIRTFIIKHVYLCFNGRKTKLLPKEDRNSVSFLKRDSYRKRLLFLPASALFRGRKVVRDRLCVGSFLFSTTLVEKNEWNNYWVSWNFVTLLKLLFSKFLSICRQFCILQKTLHTLSLQPFKFISRPPRSKLQRIPW